MSTAAPRILLVDDELSVQKLLAYPLRKEGYDVIPALDGREALERLRDDNFDLVVLDVMLPRMDGFDVCRAIRSRSTVPIIMLTAKTEETDKVLGLELGADDYITKPFSVREFRSRVKAVLRRAALAQPEAQFEEPIDAGELSIDFEKRSVVVRGEAVRLTYVEFEILAALARAPGRVFSRTMLLERVLGRRRLPRPAHDRRPHPPPAREARGGAEDARADPHRARRRLPLQGLMSRLRSLRQKIAFIFFVDHRGGVLGDLVRRGAAARAEPQGAAARRTSWTRRGTRGRRSSCRSLGGREPTREGLRRPHPRRRRTRPTRR